MVVSGRTAAVIDRHLTALRKHFRGIDPQVSGELLDLHAAAMSWRGSATGTESAVEPEPAASSDQWLSTGAAADLADVSARAVRKAIADGRLAATEVGGRYRISREDLEHWKAARAAA